MEFKKCVVVIKNIFFLVSWGLLICFCGCSFYITDYSEYDHRCKEWIQRWKYFDNSSVSAREFVYTFPDPESRFAYYMCMNQVTRSTMIQIDSFDEIASATVAMMKRNLRSMKDDMEVVYSVAILSRLHRVGAYNIADDKDIIGVMKERVELLKNSSDKEFCESQINNIISRK